MIPKKKTARKSKKSAPASSSPAELAKFVGLRAFARLRGVSPTAVSKAIASGRIRSAEKRGRKWEIDLEAASAEWTANTDPSKQRPPESSNPKRGSQADLFDDGPVRLPPTNGSGPLAVSMQRAAAIKLSCQAQLARLEYEERSGSLVKKDRVTLEAFQLARAIRDALLAIPDRLAASIAGESDERTVHEMLRVELVAVLGHLREKK
jgi:hypothetical protein